MSPARPVVALVGAGGKMGCRLTDNFLKHGADVRFVETSAPGLERLHQRGVTATAIGAAVDGADLVMLAVPDVGLGDVARQVVPAMKAGSLLVTLDPAAPLDNQIPTRAGIGCVVTHPSHPSVFNWEPTEEAFRDFYGGVSARQAVVCALLYGTEAHSPWARSCRPSCTPRSAASIASRSSRWPCSSPPSSKRWRRPAWRP